MAILSGIPVLNCQSIEKTLDFYQKILQFVVVNQREEDNKISWAHLMHGDTTLMLQDADSNAEVISSQNSKISLYFFSNNINELHRFIKVNYSSVSTLVSTKYRMREFSLVDPEGNTVIVGQTENQVS